MIRYKEVLLNQPIESLGLSAEFKSVTEILGFYTLADLLRHHTSALEKLPGFSVQLLHEYLHFLEEKNLGHYIDPVI